ncbi:MAG: TatD family nuclease-associated radical SAM protein [Clostridiales bacterium]|nr:TatD family nuclease-associated radical SAM protein [Clostridiales bacterium]
MTITYVYGDNLYVNSTNRCDCACAFCLRTTGDRVGDSGSLWLEREPSKEEILADIRRRDLSQYRELVFCGYGEPTYRLEDILWVAEQVKGYSSIPIRMDTNGHSDLIHGRPTAHLFAGRFDILSVSLNRATAAAYQETCRSRYGEASFQAMLDFTREAVSYVPKVIMTVVDTIPPAEIEACRQICEGLGAVYRVRTYSTQW